MSKAVIMPQTERILAIMGEQIKLARLRRHIPMYIVAERSGLSRQTVISVEKGLPSVSIGNYAMVLHAIQGMDNELLNVCKDDKMGRTIQDLELKIPKRVREK